MELLVAIGVIAVLAALLLPALGRSRASARRITCLANLHQLGLACQMYWDDHLGAAFRYRRGSDAVGDLYWFGWLERGPEGQRRFDPTQGVLFPYLGGRGVEICPSLPYHLRQFKRKARGAAYGYGYNLHLSRPASAPPLRLTAVRRPSSKIVLADAAQVNTFQPPASPDNPMLEEFYYVNRSEPTAHFRHAERAQAVFVDGHAAGGLQPVPGSWDVRLPEARVARLPAQHLLPEG